MIEKLYKEIWKCLNNDAHLAALFIALSLPDICGKAEYPKDSPSSRYKSFIDNNFTPFQNLDYDESEDSRLSHLSGEVIYQLRCSFFHEGSSEPEYKKLNFTDNVPVSKYKIFTGEVASIISKEEYCISAKQLAIQLAEIAIHYYMENKEKFRFLKDSVFDIDDLLHTKTTKNILTTK